MQTSTTSDASPCVIFTNKNGKITQHGEIESEYARFEWFDGNEWHGGWTVEPTSDCLDRMHRSGPYKYPTYRITGATKPPLDIAPTCAGCGIIAGIDCQHTVEYLFGPAAVTNEPKITFDNNHQFQLSVSQRVKGRHVVRRKTKTLTFNSVRCAELYLIKHRHCTLSDEPIGSGLRLRRYLEHQEQPKVRKTPAQIAKERVWGAFSQFDSCFRFFRFKGLPLQKCTRMPGCPYVR